MTAPLVVEVDGKVYLERQNRARVLVEKLSKGTEPVVVREWAEAMAALQREADPLPLVVGARYRIRMLAGPPAVEHRHYEDETGAIHGLDVPTVGEVEYVELEGVFAGRMPSPFVGQVDDPPPGTIVLDVAGRLAVLADMDVLRIEEIR